MRVIGTSGSRLVRVVLRDYSLNEQYAIIVINESTNDSITITTGKTIASIQSSNDLFEFKIDEVYLEGAELSFYIIQPETTKILHRNKIFVTDQETQNWNE